MSMKRLALTAFAIVILLTGCHAHPQKPKPKPLSGPIITKTSIKPASITINPATGWSAAPTAGHMPVYSDIDPVIQFFPPTLAGTLIIQRRGGGENPDTGFLDGKVTVPTAATLYIALRTTINDDTLITPDQLAAFIKEGWTYVPGIFSLSEPPGQFTRWQVFSHPLDPGPITLTSKTLPNGGLFFIGRVR